MKHRSQTAASRLATLFLCAVFALLQGCAQFGTGASTSPVIDRILSRGELVVGTAGSMPPLSATFNDMSGSRKKMPAFDPMLCTGCSKCWTACPDSAIGAVAAAPAALLDAGISAAGAEAVRQVAGLALDPSRREFEFRPGPIMSQVVLADEINRATPRTQSALLEAMQERQVTVDVETMALPRPFLVLATQNPIELEGTFPLPEAQIDRFLMRVALGYPSKEDENAILLRYERQDPLATLEPVTQADDLLAMQEQVRSVLVEESVRGYMVDVVRATREHEAVGLGRDVRIEARRLAGGALLHENRIIHLCAFRLEEGEGEISGTGRQPRRARMARASRRGRGNPAA